MSKKSRKGAEARKRDGHCRDFSDIVGRDNVESLLKAINSGSLCLDDEHAQTMQSADMLAEVKIQKSFQETMAKIATGEFNDPDKWDYGDGDQSPLKFPESQNLRSLWGKKNHFNLTGIPCCITKLNNMLQLAARTIHLHQMLLICHNG